MPIVQGLLLGLQLALEVVKYCREQKAAGVKLTPDEVKALKAKMLADAKGGIPSKPVSKEPVELKP